MSKIAEQTITYRNDNINRLFADLRRYKPLDNEENLRLSALAKAGDKKAFDQMVTHNLLLVVSVVNELPHNADQQQEYFQEGYFGLVQAVKRFDPAKGVKFSSFAWQYIKYYILKYIERDGETVRNAEGGTVSLSAPLGQDDDCGTLEDVLTDEGCEATDARCIAGSDYMAVHAAIDRLSDVKRQIVCKTYGIDGDFEESLSNICEQMSLSHEGVRKARKSAEREIRSYLECA